MGRFPAQMGAGRKATPPRRLDIARRGRIRETPGLTPVAYKAETPALAAALPHPSGLRRGIAKLLSERNRPDCMGTSPHGSFLPV